MGLPKGNDAQAAVLSRKSILSRRNSLHKSPEAREQCAGGKPANTL